MNTLSIETRFKHTCSEENATKFWDWLQNRGGIAVWKSTNLGYLGASWSTPANQQDDPAVWTSVPKRTLKPTWQAENNPTIYADESDIGVETSELFKTIPVSLKNGYGLYLTLTGGSQRKVDKALQKCHDEHGNSFYVKGGLHFPEVEIRYTTKVVPIAEYIRSLEAK